MTSVQSAAETGATTNPITVEVVGSAFESIVDEMGEALVRSSHSTNIKERRDCSTALFDAEGAILCQAQHVPMHLGSFISFVPLLLARYRDRGIEEGDVFIGNDAYEGGGTHLPDIVLAEPVFASGELVAWVINTAHHSDFVDRGNAHIFQEGIRLPPVRLYRRGELQSDLQDVFLLNCQVPQERISDLRAQMAANRLGVSRFRALCDKYGVDVVRQVGRDLQDYAERRIRAGIAMIPDGTYGFTDVFDTSAYAEDLEVGVEITIAGDQMVLRFDSPPQVRSGLNLIYTGLLASVYYAVKSIVDPEAPPNSGIARPLTVEAEPGTLLNCSAPAAVANRAVLAQRVVDLVYGALAPVIPQRVTAAGNGSLSRITFVGQRQDRSNWVYLETIGGGSGARYNKDGLDGVHVHMTNTSNLPVEALETEYPLTVLRYELVDGSGGAGEYRGGMGLRRVYRVDQDCRVGSIGARERSQPWGLQGGSAGASGYCRIAGGPVVGSGFVSVDAGGIIEIVTPGAGGFGRASDRDPALVDADQRSGVMGGAPA